MKTHTEAEKHELEMIDHEIRAARRMELLYLWVGMPAIITFLGLMIWSQL